MSNGTTNGHGATTTTQAVKIFPIGALIPVYVQDATAFPSLCYVLITDGIYALTGQVTVSDIINNILSVRITSIINGVVGLSLQHTATVTFSGPPGKPGYTKIGDLGTVLFKDFSINSPIEFVSDSIPLNPNIINVSTFILPNNQTIQYRIVAEFIGNIVTNQALTNNLCYLGIASSAAIGAINTSGTFAGYSESATSPIAAPVINYPTIIADSVYNVNIPNGPNNIINPTVKFIGTFGAGIQLDFSIIAAMVQPNTTFYIQGIFTILCYPLYQ